MIDAFCMSDENLSSRLKKDKIIFIFYLSSGENLDVMHIQFTRLIVPGGSGTLNDAPGATSYSNDARGQKHRLHTP